MNQALSQQFWAQSASAVVKNSARSPGSWLKLELLLDFNALCRWQESLTAEPSLWTQSVRLAKVEHKCQNIFAVTFELAVQYLVGQVVRHSLTTTACVVLPAQDQDQLWSAYNYLAQINHWPTLTQQGNVISIGSVEPSQLSPTDNDSADSSGDESDHEPSQPESLQRYFFWLDSQSDSAKVATTPTNQLVRLNLPIPADTPAATLLKIYQELDYLMTATGVLLVPATQWPLPVLLELPDLTVIKPHQVSDQPTDTLLCSTTVTSLILQDRLRSVQPVQHHNLLPDRSDLALVRELLALAGVSALLEEPRRVWYRLPSGLKLAEHVECLTASLILPSNNKLAMYAFVLAYRGKFSYPYLARWRELEDSNLTELTLDDNPDGVKTKVKPNDQVFQIDYYVNTAEEKQSFEAEFRRVWAEVRQQWLEGFSGLIKTVVAIKAKEKVTAGKKAPRRKTKAQFKPLRMHSVPTNSLLTARKFHLRYPDGAIFVETINDREIYWLLRPEQDPDAICYHNIDDAIIRQALVTTQDIDVITLEPLSDISLDDMATGVVLNGGFYRAAELVNLTKDPLTRHLISPQLRWDCTVAPSNHLGMGLVAIKPVANDTMVILRRGDGNQTHTNISVNFGPSVKIPDYLLADDKLQQLYQQGHYLPQASNIYAKRYGYNINTRMCLSMAALLAQDQLTGELETEWLLKARND